MSAPLRIGALCIALLAPGCGFAFKLQPPGFGATDLSSGATDRQASGFLALFTSDVHERITRRAYESAGVPLSDSVIAGVRWNDNPPAMRLGALFGGCSARDMKASEEVDCWTSMLRVDRMAWEVIGRREKSIAPLRSHFGDMQFLHAMSPSAGESAAETRGKILQWSEFAYRVARGEIGPRVKVHDLQAKPLTLDPAAGRWVGGLFGGAGKQLWSVQDVFLPKPGDLRLVAFGTLLHLVEDSYSASHLRRATTRVQSNGCPSYDAADPVLEFHTYAEQDTQIHAICDDAPDWLLAPRPGDPVTVLAELVRAYANGAQWPAVKEILEQTVFRLAEHPHEARAGRCFERRADANASEDTRPPPTALEPSCREETAP